MKLPPADAKLFFELVNSLYYFVNSNLKIISNIHSPTDLEDLAQEERVKLREAVFGNPALINDYVAQNPSHYDDEKLTIIWGWKQFIRDQFFIERYLKNYAIFINGDNAVYGVLALSSSFDEVCPKSYLPIYVEAILLPFKGNIIYDGFLATYHVSFGSGMKGDLKEIYLRAKQNDRIILSLDSANEAQTRATAAKSPKAKSAKTKAVDWSKELGQLNTLAKRLKGGTEQPMINGPAFSLVKASLELATQAIADPNNADALYKALKANERALKKVADIIYRMD